MNPDEPSVRSNRSFPHLGEVDRGSRHPSFPRRPRRARRSPQTEAWVDRHGRRARRFHAAVSLLTIPLIVTGAWLYVGGEGDPRPLARATGVADTELHTWLGRGFAVLVVALLLVGRRAIAPFVRETFRHDRGDARWWRRLPAAVLTGRFGRHEGTFDPGQRLANVAIVGGLLLLTATGIGLTIVHGGQLFAEMARMHRWAAIVATGPIAAHVIVAVGMLPATGAYGDRCTSAVGSASPRRGACGRLVRACREVNAVSSTRVRTCDAGGASARERREQR